MHLIDVIAAWNGTKTELARTAGMSLQQLGHLRRGGVVPTLSQAAAMDDVFGIGMREWLR